MKMPRLLREHFLPYTLAAAAGVVLLAAGCDQPGGQSAADSARDRLVVACANYPLQYFARRIAGDRVETVLPAPADVDPTEWHPRSDDILALQHADLILLNGATYEKWLPKVSLPESKLVDTSAGFAGQFLHQKGVTHQHGPGGKHTHGATAITTWLDFSLAARQAAAVHEALRRLLPDQVAALQAGFTGLTNDLAALDQEFAAWAGKLGGAPVIASHPVYQYFARRYGLNLKSVHWEPGETPDAAAWQDFETLRQSHPAKLMIWESAPAGAVMARLAALGVTVAVVAPCGNAPASGNFLTVMRENLARLKAAEKQGAVVQP